MNSHFSPRPTRWIAVLSPFFLLAPLGESVRAAVIEYAGFVEGTQVADWRTGATPKAMDIDGDSVYGSSLGAVHWTIGSTGERPAGSNLPGWSYRGETTFGQFRNPGYALIDNLVNPAANIEAGIAAVQTPGRFTFELTGTAATYANKVVRVGVMADVLAAGEWAADNGKTFQLVQTAGGSANSAVVSLRGGAGGNGQPEMYFFDIKGATAGDQFQIVTGNGPAQAGYAGPMSWDLGASSSRLFHAAAYRYSTAPNADASYYKDNALDAGSSVGDLNDGVRVTAGAGPVIPDASVGWGAAVATDITFDLGGVVRLDWISIGHAGIPNFAKWAPDDVTVRFSADGVNFGAPITSSQFTLFTPATSTYQRANLVLSTPVTASHVRLSFNGGVNQNTGNFNGYLLDDVSFSGTPAGGSVLPYANNDPDTTLLYHFNEATGLHSMSPGTNFIGDGSGKGQLLRTNYDTANPGSTTSNPALSPFDGKAGPPGLGTAATMDVNQRAYRVGNANVGLLNTQTFTIEGWIRNPATTDYPGILRADTFPGTNPELVQFSLDDNGDQLRLAFFDTTGTFRAFVSSATYAFQPDTWYHVAVTYAGDGTGSDSQLRFFVDSQYNLGDPSRPGTQLGATLLNIPDINPFESGDVGDVWIGEMESANRLMGDIDEVRWSNVVRAEFNLAMVPEPSSWALAALGLAALGLAGLRRRGPKANP